VGLFGGRRRARRLHYGEGLAGADLRVATSATPGRRGSLAGNEEPRLAATDLRRHLGHVAHAGMEPPAITSGIASVLAR